MNYNEMLYNLRNFEYSLIEMNTKGFSIFEIDLILQKAKAYIHATEFLDKEYNRRINEFYKSYKNDKYTNNYHETYEEIKQFVVRKVKLNNRKIKYTEHYVEQISYEVHKVDVYDNKNQHRYFIDLPQIYYFPSFMASYVNLSGKIGDIDDLKNLKISSCLLDFYMAFCYDDNDFRRKINCISFPRYLSFFITLDNTRASTVYDYIKVIFDASAMCEVLHELQDCVENELSNKWLINPPTDPLQKLLSNEEQRVYDVLYEDDTLTVKEIAEYLGKKYNNVKAQYKALKKRLGVKSKAELREYIRIEKTKK